MFQSRIILGIRVCILIFYILYMLYIKSMKYIIKCKELGQSILDQIEFMMNCFHIEVYESLLRILG